jgi:O-antigen/teichoic acid export membrane protein
MSKESRANLDALVSIGRGTTWMAIGSFLFLIFGFFGRLGVARIVPVSSWGLFNIGISLAGFLSIVALLGLQQATARALSFERDPWVRRAVVRRSLLITSLDAAGVSIAVYLFAPALARVFSPGSVGPLTQVFELFSILVGFTLMSSYLSALFQGFERAQPNAWFNQILGPGLFVVFLGISFVLRQGFTGVLVGYVAAAAIAFVALLFYTLHRLPPVFARPDGPPPERIRVPSDFWQLSLSLWGVSSLAFIMTFADTLILAVFWPAVTVGLYSAATTFARLFLLVNGALAYIFLPVTARLAREKAFRVIQWTYVTSTRWVIAIGVPLLFLFLFLPGQSLRELFGGSYRAAALPLQILTLGAFASLAVGPVNACLAGLARSRTLLITSVVPAGANLLLSFALIPRYGAMGAAVAWTVARLANTGSGALALARGNGISAFRRALVLPLAVTLAVGIPLFTGLAVLHVPGWSIFPLAIGAFGLFLGASLLTHSLNRGDLLIVRAVERILGRPLPRTRSFLERFMTPDPLPSLPPGPE